MLKYVVDKLINSKMNKTKKVIECERGQIIAHHKNKISQRQNLR